MYAIKGDILYSKEIGKLNIIESGYIIVKENTILDVFHKLPEKYKTICVEDYTGSLIIPGLIDLHLHAPQYPNIGLGMDKELMPWLETYTFPEESKYSNLEYAKRVYVKLIEELWKNGTTRCCVFSSIHKESTELLMDLFNTARLGAYVGKVNMDLNCPSYIIEDTEKSINETEELIVKYKNKYTIVNPIITPRFAPSCSDELMTKVANLAGKYGLPIQSHLSENISEINFVKSLFPHLNSYTEVYMKSGLIGNKKTVMAHCVHLTDSEIDILKNNDVFVAHCPTSNTNLISGIAPIRKLIDRGIKIGLGSDIAGGHTLSMCEVMKHAIQVSNLKFKESSFVDKPLTIAEVFHLTTKGAGEFFGKIGSFEPGFIFDALVIDDRNTECFKQLSIEERLQRFIYTGDYKQIKARYIDGKLINKPNFI